MELPHIGDQCDQANCRQLDFLPVKCDGCKNKFCAQHWTYQGHNCSSPRLKVRGIYIILTFKSTYM